MSDQNTTNEPGWLSRMPEGQSTLPASAEQALRAAAAEVMAVQDVTSGGQRAPLRIRGKLTLPSDEAFRRLRKSFETAGFTPALRREENLEAIYALPIVFGKEPSRPPRLAIILLVLTILSVFHTGLLQSGVLYDEPITAALAQATGNLQWLSHPDLLPDAQGWQEALTIGLYYTLALLGILGTHEMGHYIVARINKVNTTLPFFIPLPFIGILGTMGAVIAMREPAPNRRVQFDIGIAGPLAGLVVCIPVLIIGLLRSQVITLEEHMQQLPESVRDEQGVMHEGQSIVYWAAKYLIFGRTLPDGDLDVWIDPVAFAGWAGLFVTALNLVPLGQLDGGHVLYGLFGDKARLARVPIIGAMIVLAIAGGATESGYLNPGFGWTGWWLWAGIAIFLLRGHAPVLDEITGLDFKRRALGIAMLVVFILIFMPTPLTFDSYPLGALLGPMAM